MSGLKRKVFPGNPATDALKQMEELNALKDTHRELGVTHARVVAERDTAHARIQELERAAQSGNPTKRDQMPPVGQTDPAKEMSDQPTIQTLMQKGVSYESACELVVADSQPKNRRRRK